MSELSYAEQSITCNQNNKKNQELSDSYDKNLK